MREIIEEKCVSCIFLDFIMIVVLEVPRNTEKNITIQVGKMFI